MLTAWALSGSFLNPTVILIRHGETALNKERRIRAWMDVEIDPAARHVIARTASRLDLLPLANPIFSSDLRRARQTAEIVANETLLEIVFDGRMRPWNVGELSGQKIEEIAPIMERYIAHPNKQIPGGESFQEFLSRWKDVFQELITKAVRNPREIIVAVTHSRNIEATRFFVTGDRRQLVSANSVPPGCAISWQVVDGKLREIPLGGDSPNTKEQHSGSADPDS